MLPVIIINGPLGSGKTTLIHSLLNNEFDASKTIWLKTEFGDKSIDEYLLQDTGVQTQALTGGCICHVLLSQLDGVMTSIASMPDIDYVVIETSGMTHPIPVVQTIERHPQFRVAHVALLVDVTHVSKPSYPHPMLIPEMAVAPYDLIIFNKYDVSLTPDQEGELEKTLDPWYEGAYDVVEKLKIPNKETDDELYRERTGIWGKQLLQDARKALVSPPRMVTDARLPTFDEGKVEDHEGDIDVLSFRIDGEQIITRAQVDAYAQKLPDNVVRAKGVFHTGADTWEFFNWVRGDSKWSPLAATAGNQILLVMGQGLEKKDIDFNPASASK